MTEHRWRKPLAMAIGVVGLSIAAALVYARPWQERIRWQDEQQRFFALSESMPRGDAGADAAPAPPDGTSSATPQRGLHQGEIKVRQIETRWASDGADGARVTVDRCTTCHLGVADERMIDPALPKHFRAHPAGLFAAHPPERFGCTACHGGDGMETRMRAHQRWVLRDTEHGRGWALSSTKTAELMLQTGELSEVLVDERDDELEVAVDSSGWQKVSLASGSGPTTYRDEAAFFSAIGAVMTKALSGSIAPARVVVRKMAGRVQIALEPKSDARIAIRFPKRELAEVLGFAPDATLPSAVLTAPRAPRVPVRGPAEERWDEKGRYVAPDGARGLAVPLEYLDRFLLALPEVEAGCTVCHSRETDLRPRAASPSPSPSTSIDPVSVRSEGRRLFRDLACGGCHALKGEPARPHLAPPLADLAAKARPEWVLAFLRQPRALIPKTTMPRFWPVPLDAVTKEPFLATSPLRAAWEARMRSETLSIAAFLLGDRPRKAAAASARLADKIARYATVPGASAEEGRALFVGVGCAACHATSEQGLPEAFRDRERDPAPSLAAAGSKLREDWTAYYLEDPARLHPSTRMPSMRLDRREAASLAKYIATLEDPALAPHVAPTEIDTLALRPHERVRCNVGDATSSEGVEMDRSQCGERLVVSYGCAGCHAIDGLEKEERIGAPLDGFAEKDGSAFDFGDAMLDPTHRTRDAFVAWKLDAPRLFVHGRSTLKMPDYDLSAREIRALTVFLAGLTNASPEPRFDPYASALYEAMERGERLVASSGCRSCHVIGGEGVDFQGSPDLRAEGARVQPEWLFASLRDPGAHGVRPQLHPEWVYGNLPPPERIAVRMPTFALTVAETTAITQYFALADHADFPYSDPHVRKLTPQEKIRATVLLNRAAPDGVDCLACHYVGELPIERAKTDLDELAPNLGLASKRLRPEWTRAWLASPSNGASHARTPRYKEPQPADADLVRDFLFLLSETTRLPGKGDEARAPLP